MVYRCVFLLVSTLFVQSCVHENYQEFRDNNGDIVACESYASISNNESVWEDTIAANRKYDKCLQRARRNGWTPVLNGQDDQASDNYDYDWRDEYGDPLSDEDREELEKEVERLKKKGKKLRAKRKDLEVGPRNR